MANNSDGKVVISTKLDNSALPKGIGQVKGMLGGLDGVVKKLGGAIATAFSAKVVADFAKECLDLGSDLQEVQNVVDVTFTTMNEQVNEFARNAAKTAGLSETMAKKYAGTFGAMAKSFKFTEAEAYEMSTALTQMSGDVASFYNLSQDEAYTKLKSVFTGETESLKDLGVVMTQTALDSYALANGFGKTTSQMTEQEKVALRYRFVMDHLAGASGDFLRTSDSWANQTRLLTLQFDQLKATLGQGLINVLTPVIKFINTLIAKFQVFADKFLEFTNTVFGNAGGASSGMTEAAESAETLGDSVEEAGKKAKKYLAPFDEIAKIANDGTVGSALGSSDESFLVGGGSTTEIGGTVKDNISPVLDQIAQKIRDFIAPIQNMDFGPLKQSLSKLGGSFENLGGKIVDGLGWAWQNIIAPLGEWVIEEAAPWTVDLLAESFDGLSDVAGNLGDIFVTLWEKAGPVLDELKEAGGVTLDAIREEILLTIEKLDALTAALSDALKGDWDAAESEISRYLESVRKSFENFTNWWNEMMKFDWFEWLINLLAKGFEGVMYSGSGSSGFAMPAFTSFSTPIPHLAQGAVIPPNREFLAVLGDQRHGTNVEAPLSTIQEAVAAVMADYEASNLAGHEATVEVLQQLLVAVLGIEVGDTTIGQAANRYNQKMAVIKGGL